MSVFVGKRSFRIKMLVIIQIEILRKVISAGLQGRPKSKVIFRPIFRLKIFALVNLSTKKYFKKKNSGKYAFAV